jgi:hypothetical protein
MSTTLTLCIPSCYTQYCCTQAQGRLAPPAQSGGRSGLLLLLHYCVELMQADWDARQAVLAGYSQDPGAAAFIKQSLLWQMMSQVSEVTQGSGSACLIPRAVTSASGTHWAVRITRGLPAVSTPCCHDPASTQGPPQPWKGTLRNHAGLVQHLVSIIMDAQQQVRVPIIHMPPCTSGLADGGQVRVRSSGLCAVTCCVCCEVLFVATGECATFCNSQVAYPRSSGGGGVGSEEGPAGPGPSLTSGGRGAGSRSRSRSGTPGPSCAPPHLPESRTLTLHCLGGLAGWMLRTLYDMYSIAEDRFTDFYIDLRQPNK